MTRTCLIAAVLLLPSLACAQEQPKPKVLTGLAKVIEDARTARLLEEGSRERYFRVSGSQGDELAVVTMVHIGSGGALKSGVATFSKGGLAVVTETDLEEGRLTEVELKTMKMAKPRAERKNSRGVVRDGTLDWVAGDVERESVVLREGTLPLNVALFVLPSFHEQLQAVGWGTYEFPVLVDGERVLGGKLTVNVAPEAPAARPKPTANEQAVTVSHVELGTATVYVSTAKADKGRILAVKTFEGAWLEATTKRVIEELTRKEEEKLGIGRGKGARQSGNEAAALGSLKTISTAQSLFREGDKDGDGQLDYAASLAELGKARLIDGVLASGVKQGYTFEMCAGSEAPEFLFMVVASPTEPGKSGKRHFAMNQMGVVYASDAPFELDTKGCEIKGGKPVGR